MAKKTAMKKSLCETKNRKFANGEKNSDEEVRREETGRHESDEGYEGYEREEVIVTCFTIDSDGFRKDIMDCVAESSDSVEAARSAARGAHSTCHAMLDVSRKL